MLWCPVLDRWYPNRCRAPSPGERAALQKKKAPASSVVPSPPPRPPPAPAVPVPSPAAAPGPAAAAATEASMCGAPARTTPSPKILEFSEEEKNAEENLLRLSRAETRLQSTETRLAQTETML